jgi:hypothetical protein
MMWSTSGFFKELRTSRAGRPVLAFWRAVFACLV